MCRTRTVIAAACGLALALAAVPAAAVPAKAEAPLVPIAFSGNILFTDETCLAILDMGTNAPATPAAAARITNTLEKFLRRSGYELATVGCVLTKSNLLVTVDEGRLEKIVFEGFSGFNALRLQLELDLPLRVFNRPHLERQLERLRKARDFPPLVYRLRPTRDGGPNKRLAGRRAADVPDLGRLGGAPIIPRGARWELSVLQTRPLRRAGFWWGVDWSSLDGLVGKMNYSGQDLLVGRDRFKVEFIVGARPRNGLDDGKTYVALTRGSAEATWSLPFLRRSRFRPIIWLKSDLTGLQRRQFGVENSFIEILEGGASIGFEPFDGFIATLGGGYQGKTLLRVVPAAAATNTPAAGGWARPFLLGSWYWDLSGDRLLRGSRHFLQFDARYYFVNHRHAAGATLAYSRLVEIGWHELSIGVRGAMCSGESTFDELVPVGGKLLRGVFNDREYARRAAAASLEYRHSLARDVWKVSLFHDLAVWTALAPGGRARVGNAFGPGMHVLLLDQFQLAAYLSFGFANGRAHETGFAFKLNKAF